MLFAAIGDGSFAVVIGIFMKLTPDMLFYGMCVMNLTLIFLVKVTTKNFIL